MKKVKHQRNNLYFFIGLLVLFLGVIIFFSLKIYSSFSILYIQSISYTLNVSDQVGFNLESDKLHFGEVVPGGSSKRTITLASDLEGYVFVFSNHDASWIFVNHQGAKIGPDDNVYFEFQAVIPKDASYQDIEEELSIYIMKSPKLWPLKFISGNLLKTYDGIEVTPTIRLNISNPDDSS